MAKVRIRMLVGISGMDFSLSPGDETERFSRAEAIRLIESGQAAPVAEPKVEKAVRKAPERRAGAKAGKGILGRAKTALGLD